MRLQAKLTEWQTAGLIDREAVERILLHERRQSRPLLMYAMGTLGGLSTAIGLLSVIAANWDGISSGVKLTLALALGAGLAIATFFSHEAKRSWGTEILVILYYGYTLGAFALIGQIYHSGTPPYVAFLLWTAVTVPLVLLGQSYLLGAIWLAGLVTSHAFIFAAFFEHLERSWEYGRSGNTQAICLFVSPFIYLMTSRIPWFVRNRPRYSAVFGVTGWLVLVAACAFSQFIWYGDIGQSETLHAAIPICDLLLVVFAVFLNRLYPTLTRQSHLAIGMTLGMAAASTSIGLAFPRDDVPLVGSVSCLLMLAVAAWACLSLGAYRWFHLVTGLIALRLIAIYFEVFGSMMDTGLGLMLGGGLTILLAWLWRNKSSQLAGTFAKTRESTHA